MARQVPVDERAVTGIEVPEGRVFEIARGGGRSPQAAALVKVFGCRQAYENRPSTNPRGCGDGLWGFRILPVRGDGAIGAAARPMGAW